MCISSLRSITPNHEAEAFTTADLCNSGLEKPNNEKVSLKRHRKHIIVQHNYHDHAAETETTSDIGEEIRGSANSPFPTKLQEMLERVEEDGNSHIISWQPHGRCFVVHKLELFKTILPHYFKLSKIASFQRQLNLYGFQRITRGPDKGGYYHELFLRNRAFLSHRIQRVKVKGTGVRARSNPEQEPDLWSMAWMTPAAPTGTVPDSASSVVSMDSPVSESDSSFSVVAVEPLSNSVRDQDDSILSSWGKTFHYLGHLPVADLVPEEAIVPTPARSSTDLAAMDSLLEEMDFDTLVHELFDSEVSFADLLDRFTE
jgi:hypothetical protein